MIDISEMAARIIGNLLGVLIIVLILRLFGYKFKLVKIKDED